VWRISLLTQDFFIFEARHIHMSKKGEVSPFTLIEPGKMNIPSFKDQGCDVRSVGRSSRSMRQAVACLMWEIFCNEMNLNTWNPRGYSCHEGSFPLNRFIPSLRRLRVPAVQRCYQSRKVSQVILLSLDKAPRSYQTQPDHCIHNIVEFF
jgi:hypothetical protein